MNRIFKKSTKLGVIAGGLAVMVAGSAVDAAVTSQFYRNYNPGTLSGGTVSTYAEGITATAGSLGGLIHWTTDDGDLFRNYNPVALSGGATSNYGPGEILAMAANPVTGNLSWVTSGGSFYRNYNPNTLSGGIVSTNAAYQNITALTVTGDGQHHWGTSTGDLFFNRNPNTFVGGFSARGNAITALASYFDGTNYRIAWAEDNDGGTNFFRNYRTTDLSLGTASTLDGITSIAYAQGTTPVIHFGTDDGRLFYSRNSTTLSGGGLSDFGDYAIVGLSTLSTGNLNWAYVVPEPASLALLALGSMAILGRRRRASAN